MSAAFTVDLRGRLQLMNALSAVPKDVQRAQNRAVATLRRRIRTEARRDIQQEYNLKAGRINQGLRVGNRPDGVALTGVSRGINAIEFGARWTRGRGFRGGATYALKRGQDRRAHAGEFIATGLSGNRLVFSRGGKGAVRTKSGAWPRLPLKAIYGPSIAQMLKHAGRPERLEAFARRVIAAELDRLLQAQLARAGQ